MLLPELKQNIYISQQNWYIYERAMSTFYSCSLIATSLLRNYSLTEYKMGLKHYVNNRIWAYYQSYSVINSSTV